MILIKPLIRRLQIYNFAFKIVHDGVCHPIISRGTKQYFDILNRLGVNRKCNEQTDGQTEWLLAIMRYNIAKRSLKY